MHRNHVYTWDRSQNKSRLVIEPERVLSDCLVLYNRVVRQMHAVTLYLASRFAENRYGGVGMFFFTAVSTIIRSTRGIEPLNQDERSFEENAMSLHKHLLSDALSLAISCLQCYRCARDVHHSRGLSSPSTTLIHPLLSSL